MKREKKEKNKAKIWIIFGLILFAIWFVSHTESSNQNSNSDFSIDNIEEYFSDFNSEKEDLKIPRELQNNVKFWEKIFFEKSMYSVIFYTPNQNINIKQVDIDFDISLENKGFINVILKSDNKEIERFNIMDLIDTKNPDTILATKQIKEKIDKIYDELNYKLHANETLRENENIGYTRGRKEKFEKSWKNSGKFILKIKEIFEEENIPKDIAYLAFTESSFDHNAHSSSNALGIFQMIPQTARNYGLTVNSNIDERRDPLLEARATAKYLKKLHNEFGNWLWAINAYHSGENNLRKAQDWADKNHPKKPKNFSGNLKQYQYLKIISDFPYDKEFNNGKTLRYGSQSARYTTMFLAFIEGKHILEKNIKLDKSVNFDIYKINYQKDYTKNIVITVKPGDTLSAISYKYGLSIDKIKQQNNLDNSFIKSGQKLELLIENPPITIKEFIEKLNLSNKEKEFFYQYNFSYIDPSKNPELFLNKKIYSASTINLPLGKLGATKQIFKNY